MTGALAAERRRLTDGDMLLRAGRTCVVSQTEVEPKAATRDWAIERPLAASFSRGGEVERTGMREVTYLVVELDFLDRPV